MSFFSIKVNVYGGWRTPMNRLRRYASLRHSLIKRDNVIIASLPSDVIKKL